MAQGYHRSMRKLSALIGVVSVLVLVSACGVSVGPNHTLDAPSVADEISARLTKEYKDYGVKSPPVSCPAGIEASKGTTFVCTTVLDGQPLDLDGTVTGSNGRYEVVPRDAIVRIDRLESYLASNIAKTTRVTPTDVDCGTNRLAVVAVGAPMTCSATFERPPTPVTVTASVRQDGTVIYQLQKSAT
jgi:hypothetical protein